MSREIHHSIAELVGRTPLLTLHGLINHHQLTAEVIAKLEYFNPNHSIKDRTALAMLEQAERSGKLKPGDTLVETTSGNTGIGLAAIAAAKGYKFRVYINDYVSLERTKLIRAFGGEVIKFSEVEHFTGILEASDGDFVAATKWLENNVIAKLPDHYFTAQLENPSNPEIHRTTTGPEIWQQTAGQVDIVIAAVGTGGTVSGVGQFFRQQNPAVQIIAVEPGIHSRPSAENPDPLEITGVHQFTDIAPERIPPTMNSDIYHEALAVETWQAYQAAREVAQTDGILIGESSGAVLHAAKIVASRPENEGKKIVVILADSGLTYLSTDLFNIDVSIEQLKTARAQLAGG